MARIGKKHNASATRVALAWLFIMPAVTSVIIGAKKKDQLIDNIESTKLQLSPEELTDLKTISSLTPEYTAWMVNRQVTSGYLV